MKEEDYLRRKAVLSQALRHPVRTLSVINRNNVRMFFSSVHYGGLKSALQTTINVLGNSMDDYRRSENRELYLNDIHNIPEHFSLPVFDDPVVSVVIPVYNQYEYTLACLYSLLENTRNVPYEVIIGDDCSSDETVNLESHVDNVRRVRNDHNLGFTLNCNHAAESARGKYILFLNNDTIVQEDWLAPMVLLMDNDEKVGIVGSKLRYPDGILQEAGGIIWSDATVCNYGKGFNPNDPPYNYVKEVDYISGASLMIRSDLFRELGGFDPRYAPAYCEDSDLCLAVRNAGYRVLYQPKSEVVHFEGLTHGRKISKRINPLQDTNIEKLREKWSSFLEKNNALPGTDMHHARDRSFGKKSILFVTDHVPSDNIEAEWHSLNGYIELLKEMGYSVTIAPRDYHYDSTHTVRLQQKGIEVLYGAQYLDDWKSIAKKDWKVFEYIVLVGFYCADEYLDYLEKNSKAKIYYMQFFNPQTALERENALTHDSQILLQLATVKRRNREIIAEADGNIVVNPIDEKYVLGYNRSGIVVTLSPTQRGLPVAWEKNSKNILFIGSSNNKVCADALGWFSEKILPGVLGEVPEARLHVLGMNGAESSQESDRMVFYGPDDIGKTPGCSLFVNPIRIGSGIRDIVREALFSGMPVISTEAGMECLASDYPTSNIDSVMIREIIRILKDSAYAEEHYVYQKFVSDNNQSALREKLKQVFF